MLRADEEEKEGEEELEEEEDEEEEEADDDDDVALDIDRAKVSTSRKYSRLRSLTFDASFFSSTRLNRELRSAVCGGAFKICTALKRML